MDETGLESTKDTKVKVYGVRRCQEFAALKLEDQSVNPKVGYNGMRTPPFALFTLLFILELICTSPPIA